MTYSRSVISLGTLITSTNKTHRHDITEILLNKSGVKHHKPNNQNCLKLYQSLNI